TPSQTKARRPLGDAGFLPAWFHPDSAAPLTPARAATLVAPVTAATGAAYWAPARPCVRASVAVRCSARGRSPAVGAPGGSRTRWTLVADGAGAAALSRSQPSRFIVVDNWAI